MTIAKRILSGVLLLCLILSFGSCYQRNEDYPFESLVENEKGSIPAYRIVLPADCSSFLCEKAEFLEERLEEQTGVPVSVVFDYESVSDAVPEILLGYTSRGLSRSSLGLLRRDDYLCISDGRGGAVLGGKTDAATVAAVDRFCRELLSSASSECLMREDSGFFYEAVYSPERILLNGFELGRYCLVYPDDPNGKIRAMVMRFRDRITERCGYVLDILSGEESQGTEKQIRLRQYSDLSESRLTHLSPIQEGIEIGSYGIFGFSVGLLELESMLSPREEQGAFRLDLEQIRSIPYEKEAYRIGTVQMNSDTAPSSPSELTQLLLSLGKGGTDAITFDTLDRATYDRINDGLFPNGYEGLKMNGEAIPAFAKNGSLIAVERELVGNRAAMTVYRGGSEAYGFYLVSISGSVSADSSLTVPQSVRESGLPAVVMIHAELTGKEPTLADTDSCGLRALYHETYSAEGKTYLFQCYATGDSMEITVDVKKDEWTYREITVNRFSVYS